MRPRLPPEVAERFPREIVGYIHSFVPHTPKEKKKQPSPQFEKELYRIQNQSLRGLSPNYMKGLEDFLLE